LSVGQLIKDFGKNLWQELKDVLSAIGSFLSSFFDTWSVSIDDFDAIVQDYSEIKANLQAEIDKIQNFKLEPHLKTRVINVPRAIDAIHDLVKEVKDALTDVTDEIIAPIHDLILVWKTESAQLSQSMDKPSGMARAASFLHSVETSIHQIRTAMDGAKDLTELATTITDQLNGLELLFLPQGNPRIRLKKTISARDGALRR
jgi:hypothetical protein